MTTGLLTERRRWLWVLLITISSAAFAAQEKSRLALDHYWELELASDPQISPDGRQVVFSREFINKQADEWSSELWLVDSDGVNLRFFGQGDHARWSPDGTRIAYLGKGEGEKRQLFVWTKARGERAAEITHLEEAPQDFQWSPDGTRIAFRAFVPAQSELSPLLPRPEGSRWVGEPLIIDRLHHRLDYAGDLREGFEHLFWVAADGGKVRQLTSGPWNVGAQQAGFVFRPGYDWSPDGRWIAFDGIMRNADHEQNASAIHLLEVASGKVQQLSPAGEGFYTLPRFSPDGRTLAYIGHVTRDWSWRALDVWVQSVSGGAPSRVSQDLADAPQGLHWAQNGRHLYFSMASRGAHNVYRLSLTGALQPVNEGAQVLRITSVNARGIAAGTWSDARHPREVAIVDLSSGRRTVLTDLNADLLREARLGEVSEILFRSADGTPLQGWVIHPPGFDARKKYPLYMEIHGGPQGMFDVGFNFRKQLFASEGYVVLFTNPRGSASYGTEFLNVVYKNWPSRIDREDLLAGVDAVVAAGSIDQSRMYMMGCSAGGTLVLWLAAHDQRFAAAASLCPVTNTISQAGTTDIPAWEHGWFAKPFWDDPGAWLERSPIMHVQKIRTPTMLMTGERDLRTPIGQSEEMYTALKLNGVPTRLIRLRDEYHGPDWEHPSNYLRSYLYLRDWFERFTRSTRQ